MRRAWMAAVAALWMAPAGAECLSPDAPIAGELRMVETRHPNGDLMRQPVVFVTPGSCVTVHDAAGGFVEVPLRDVHLVFNGAPAPEGLESLLGEPVTVSGYLSVPETAWHIGGVVAFEAQMVEVSGARVE